MSAANEPTVALVGNVSEGFRAIGPYENFDAAAAAHEGDECWLMTMVPPTRFQEEVEPHGEH